MRRGVAEYGNAYRVFMVIGEGKRPLGRSRRRWGIIS
jgi:hypothetical protein